LIDGLEQLVEALQPRAVAKTMSRALSTTQDITHVKRGYLTRRRVALVLASLAVTLLFAVLIALALGPEPIPVRVIGSGLLAKLSGAASPLTPEHEVILFQYRWPRILLALAVGAALALAARPFRRSCAIR
jgi:ABC-type enterobactin transport system permease subunit